MTSLKKAQSNHKGTKTLSSSKIKLRFFNLNLQNIYHLLKIPLCLCAFVVSLRVLSGKSYTASKGEEAFEELARKKGWIR